MVQLSWTKANDKLLSGMLSSRFHLPVFEQIAFDRKWASFLLFKPTWDSGEILLMAVTCLAHVLGSILSTVHTVDLVLHKLIY